MSVPDPIIVISGPTGSGKTAVAVALARQKNGLIINADSRQVYKHLDIGTGKPTRAQMQSVPHYLFSFLDPKEQINAARFVSEADQAIQTVFSHNKRPIVVGGTGLYIKSLLWGLSLPKSNATIRNELAILEKNKGRAFLYQELQTVDPRSALLIHPNDSIRIIRALEIYRISGKPKSDMIDLQPDHVARYAFKHFSLAPPRDWLYQRIEKRVNGMMELGLKDEIESILAAGYAFSDPGLKTIGYKQFQPHFEAGAPLDSTIHEIKKASKRYAKRQYCWDKAQHAVQLVPAQDIEAMVDLICLKL